MRAKIDRLSRGEKISAASALLLFVFMFVDWFGVELSGPGGSVAVPDAGGNAWRSLDFIPIVLLVAIVAALIGAGVRLVQAEYEPAVSFNTATAVLGGLSTLLVLFRVVFPPSFADFGGISVDATLKLGIVLGLIAAVGIAYGGYIAMRGEGRSFGDAADRLRRSGRGSGPPSPSSR